jgi:mycothiol synthase
MGAMLIRPYSSSDASTLARCHDAALTGGRTTPEAFERLLEDRAASDDHRWVLEANGKPLGYALAAAVPGLDEVYELWGCIDPAERGQGYGSRLLEHVLEVLKRSDARQVSRAIDSPDDPAARFLLRRGFFVEHREIRMQLGRLAGLEAAALPAGFRLQSFHYSVAIDHFLRLYELSFVGHPWYQPYQSVAEVAAELADPAELLFLCYGREAVGFLWLRWPEVDTAEIEPIGIAPAYQGRGLARPFMLAGLMQAADQGATKVTLGVWENNLTAVRLYRRLGFRRAKTVTYLAINLRQEPLQPEF